MKFTEVNITINENNSTTLYLHGDFPVIRSGDLLHICGVVLPNMKMKTREFNFYIECQFLKKITSTVIRPSKHLQIRPTFTQISQEIFSTIQGHENLKKMLLIQLVNCESQRMFDIRRQQLHILCIGDPGCGKSQFSNILVNMFNALLCVGPNMTSAGLTGAMIEGRFYPGSLIQADHRILIIDEFDNG